MFRRLFPNLASEFDRWEGEDWMAAILGLMWGWIIIFGVARDIMEALGWVK